MTNGAETERQRSYHHGDLRRALLAAAEQELAENGIEGFSLRSCAKRANVSHAAPTHHFGGVGGLLSALAAEGFERFLATTEARLKAAGDKSAEERLVALGLGYIEFARNNPALFRLMFSSARPDLNYEPLRQAANAAFEQLVSGVESTENAAPYSTHEGKLQVAAMWAVVHGLSHLILSRQMTFLNDLGETELEANLASIIASVTLS